ncbi:MAG TPA: hypothetical protein VNJ07_09630 [Chitinophagales bacterium]|nr:hypothetical protein [Chitinophagales bacterium]
MKKSMIAAGAAIMIIAACYSLPGCEQPGQSTSLSPQALMLRGEYLVAALGCNDCHSPKKKINADGTYELDSARLLSGHPADAPFPAFDTSLTQPGKFILTSQQRTMFAGPWGISFSANITSDETGIGTWTEEQFFTAIRKGKYKGLEGSRSLLPMMPWQYFSKLDDTDLRAIFAYLKSTQPVSNVAPSPVLAHQTAAP